jgi:RNA polymerase sigma-70 factor, ECF subfamily
MERSPAARPLRALDDASLVRRMAGRQAEAVAELHDRYAGMLLALGIRVLGNPSDAEEVVQEAFLQAWNQAANYDPSRSSVSTWLVLLARSRAIDRLRSRRVGERAVVAAHAENPATHTSPTGAQDVFFRERRERVGRELQGLPAEQRQVLELAFYEGLTQSEIAAKTGIPLGTVKTRTLLAMKKLRQALRDDIRELL